MITFFNDDDNDCYRIAGELVLLADRHLEGPGLAVVAADVRGELPVQWPGAHRVDGGHSLPCYRGLKIPVVNIIIIIITVIINNNNIIIIIIIIIIINNISLDRVQTNPEFNFKNNIIDETSIDEVTPYHNLGHSCNYYEQSEFQDRFNNMDKQISFLSQNIRSLPGKWTEFSQLISEVNNGSFHFSVIALQEIWNVPKGTSYKTFQVTNHSTFLFVTLLV